jgi:hypothetical protein
MADTVTSQVLVSGPRRHVVVLTGVSDGTGESGVVKIDKSTLKDATGAEPSTLSIQKIQWTSQGFTYLKLSFDHTTDDTALVLSGDGCLDFSSYGGLKDPASAGGTGDLLLTSIGATAGDSYTIVLDVVL